MAILPARALQEQFFPDIPANLRTLEIRNSDTSTA